MSSIVPLVLSYFLLYKYYALFAAIFLSALILPFPNNTFLTAVGAFAGQGYFNLSYALLVALVANVLGDVTGYLLARRYRKTILKKLKLKQSKYFRRLEHYIENHAAMTVFITRFIAAVSSLVNFLAGFAPLPLKKFLLYDVAGNFLNAALFLSLGYMIGAEWQEISGLISIAGGIVLVAFLAFILLQISRKK